MIINLKKTIINLYIVAQEVVLDYSSHQAIWYGGIWTPRLHKGMSDKYLRMVRIMCNPTDMVDYKEIGKCF